MGNYTINDIARLSGYSRSTVSRVINNDPHVDPKTRNKIHEVIQQIRYEPNSIARGLVRGRVDMIALILGDVRNPFFSDIAYYVQNYMRGHGYMVMLFNSNFDLEEEIRDIRSAREMNFSGILLISSATDACHLAPLQHPDCPIVLLHRPLEGFNGDSVTQDNFQAAYILTNHLLQLGHRRIAYIHGPENSTSSISRMKGFISAMEHAKLPIEREYIYPGDYTLHAGFTLGQQYLPNLDSVPRAIICGNDLMAIGFHEACRSMGISVPQDISLAGFDDIELASLPSINLTTMHQPLEEMCNRACELMISRLKGESAAPSKIILSPSLITRNTTGPLI